MLVDMPVSESVFLFHKTHTWACFLDENIQLKLELAALKWSLNAGQSKASFDEQIAQLRETLLEVKEVSTSNSPLIC